MIDHFGIILICGVWRREGCSAAWNGVSEGVLLEIYVNSSMNQRPRLRAMRYDRTLNMVLRLGHAWSLGDRWVSDVEGRMW